jgi:hypothetical protein
MTPLDQRALHHSLCNLIRAVMRTNYVKDVAELPEFYRRADTVSLRLSHHFPDVDIDFAGLPPGWQVCWEQPGLGPL